MPQVTAGAHTVAEARPQLQGWGDAECRRPEKVKGKVGKGHHSVPHAGYKLENQDACTKLSYSHPHGPGSHNIRTQARGSNRRLLLMVLEAGSPGSKSHRVRFWRGPLLACLQPCSCCVLMGVEQLWSLLRALIPPRGPHPITSFKPTHLTRPEPKAIKVGSGLEQRNSPGTQACSPQVTQTTQTW